MASAWDAPLVIAVAPNGARLGKSDHSALPIIPAELATTAAACMAAGASLLHLHVRDAQGAHSLDPRHYRPAIDSIRAAAGDGLVLQVTTEAAGRFDRAAQMACVRALEPEAVSLAVRELAPDDAAEPEMAELAGWMADHRVSPQYILYDTADVARFADLLARGVLRPERASVLFVLGRYAAGQRSRPDDLLPFLAAWRPLGLALPWFMCAFGPLEQACALTAAALGGHVRVGFENNRMLADGTTAPDNAALVAQAAAGAALLGRPVADASAARTLLSGVQAA
jgi:uncharacterized protein (DUF849 family)